MGSDFYQDEINSFQHLPKESPLHILDFGIISEFIAPEVKKKRRELREQRKEFLIKKIKLPVYKNMIDYIRDLGKQFPEESHFKGVTNLSCYTSSKEGFRDAVDKFNIPLAYLEDAYQIQLRGPPDIQVNDWVRFGLQWGIVVGLKNKNEVIVKQVCKRTYKDEEGNYITYPLFNLYERNRFIHHDMDPPPAPTRIANKWFCKKVGHDTEASTRLRNKTDTDINRRSVILWGSLFHFINDKTKIDEISSYESTIWFSRYTKYWYDLSLDVFNVNTWLNIEDTYKGQAELGSRPHINGLTPFDVMREYVIDKYSPDPEAVYKDAQDVGIREATLLYLLDENFNS